jgi:hypothetical protein
MLPEFHCSVTGENCLAQLSGARQGVFGVALAWDCLPDMRIPPQALEIERLRVMPGAGNFPTLQSKQPRMPRFVTRLPSYNHVLLF